MRGDTVEIRQVDPFCADAAALIAALSRELSSRYDGEDDGTCHFSPADTAAPGGVFLVGYVAGRPVACGALRPLAPGFAEVKRMYVAPDVRGRGYAKLRGPVTPSGCSGQLLRSQHRAHRDTEHTEERLTGEALCSCFSSPCAPPV